MSTQTDNGRAFEWAVALSVLDQTGFPILKSASATNNKRAFKKMGNVKQRKFLESAQFGVEHILKKEAKVIKDST